MVYEIPMAQYGKQIKESIVSAEELPEDSFPYEGTSALFKDERYNINRAKELYTEDEFGHLPSIDYETGEWLKAKRYPTSWKEFLQYSLNPEVNKLGFPTENKEGFLRYPNYSNGGDISIPDLSRPNWLDKYQEGNQVPANFPWINQQGQVTPFLADEPEPKSLEDNIDDILSNPQKKALMLNRGINNDNLRHSGASMYTTESLGSTLGAAILAQGLGAAHEISNLPKRIQNTKTDDVGYYDNIYHNVIESGEDIFNNAVGSMVGMIPFVPTRAKESLLVYLSNNNMMPDGKSMPEGNKYVPKKKYGGWLDQYQGDEGSSQVQRRDPNQPFFESQTQPGTYEAQYSQPEISISPNWTEEELKRNQLRDKYIADDKKAFRHWYDKLGYDKDNVTKRANQFAYNKLAKQYLRGDKENLTPEQTKFIEKSEYANRLQPSIGSRFVEGVTNPGFNLETLGNLAAPFEYPANLVRGAIKGEFTDALKGQTPSPYFVSSDLAGTSPTEAAIASGLMDFGVDSGIGAIDVASSLNKGIRGAKLVANQADKVIYPTRAYRAEGLTQKAANARKAMFNSEQSKIYDQLVRKGDKMATKSLDEFQQYLVGNKGRAGLLNNEDMLVTEYKVPFWKKPVTENKEFVDFKEKVQRLDPNKNEYIIPGRTAIDRFLYPRRTNAIKGAPKNLTDDFIEGSYPLSYHSSEFLLPGYKYIEDQIGAVTGHDVPLFRSDFNTSHPRFDWKQPEFAPREGAGKFTRFNKSAPSYNPGSVNSRILNENYGPLFKFYDKYGYIPDYTVGKSPRNFEFVNPSIHRNIHPTDLEAADNLGYVVTPHEQKLGIDAALTNLNAINLKKAYGSGTAEPLPGKARGVDGYYPFFMEDTKLFDTRNDPRPLLRFNPEKAPWVNTNESFLGAENLSFQPKTHTKYRIAVPDKTTRQRSNYDLLNWDSELKTYVPEQLPVDTELEAIRKILRKNVTYPKQTGPLTETPPWPNRFLELGDDAWTIGNMERGRTSVPNPDIDLPGKLPKPTPKRLPGVNGTSYPDRLPKQKYGGWLDNY